jgi:hypothetical protein
MHPWGGAVVSWKNCWQIPGTVYGGERAIYARNSLSVCSTVPVGVLGAVHKPACQRFPQGTGCLCLMVPAVASR